MNLSLPLSNMWYSSHNYLLHNTFLLNKLSCYTVHSPLAVSNLFDVSTCTWWCTLYCTISNMAFYVVYWNILAHLELRIQTFCKTRRYRSTHWHHGIHCELFIYRTIGQAPESPQTGSESAVYCWWSLTVIEHTVSVRQARWRLSLQRQTRYAIQLRSSRLHHVYDWLIDWLIDWWHLCHQSIKRTTKPIHVFISSNCLLCK